MWAMAFAALVGGLIPLLLQLRKPVAESRGVSRACGGLLYAAGAVGDTMHGSMSRYGAGAGHLLVTLTSRVRGGTATTAVVKAHIHRQGGMINGKGGPLNDR